jgi:hypothetical protein
VGEFTADARHGRAYPDHDRESLSASLLRFSSNCAAGNFEAFTSEESRSVQSNSDFARFAFFVCPNADARLHVGDLYPGENVSVNGCNFYGATGSFERVIEDKECLRPYLTRQANLYLSFSVHFESAANNYARSRGAETRSGQTLRGIASRSRQRWRLWHWVWPF